MYGSSLFDNLKMLEKEDWKDFKLFVDSDFNNKGSYKEETRWLLQYISSVYPDFKHPKLNREKVANALAQVKPLVPGKLEKMMHELNSMSRNFLLWKNYNHEENAFNRNLDWLKILRNNVAEDKYLLAMDKTRKTFEAIEKVSPEYYFQKYLLEREQHEWMSTVNTMKNDLNLPEVIRSFNDYYGINILVHINHALIQQTATKINLPDFTMQTIVRINNEFSNSTNILIRHFNNISKLLINERPTPEDFQQFSELLKSTKERISEQILRELFTYLRNICTILFDNGYFEMQNILHNLHKDHLERGYFYENGKITASAYINITKMALMTKNLEWGLKFIESHKERILDKSNANEFYNISKAMYYFSLMEYDLALSMLPPTTINIRHNIIGKIIEIKCYFETKSDLLQYKTDAFKMYINRQSVKSISTELKVRHLSFIKILNQIVNLRPKDKSGINKVAKKLEKSDRIIELFWLSEKLRELL